MLGLFCTLCLLVRSLLLFANLLRAAMPGAHLHQNTPSVATALPLLWSPQASSAQISVFLPKYLPRLSSFKRVFVDKGRHIPGALIPIGWMDDSLRFNALFQYSSTKRYLQATLQQCLPLP